MNLPQTVVRVKGFENGYFIIRGGIGTHMLLFCVVSHLTTIGIPQRMPAQTNILYENTPRIMYVEHTSILCVFFVLFCYLALAHGTYLIAKCMSVSECAKLFQSFSKLMSHK